MATHPDKPPLLRTLLILGRVSNLPTVWSNCLAGWLLAGGGAWSRFAVLCGGASLLYIGGMFLNDACDVRFDTAHRKERPIPSGAITARATNGASISTSRCTHHQFPFQKFPSLEGSGVGCLSPLPSREGLGVGLPYSTTPPTT